MSQSLTIALAMIMSVETTNMDTQAVGDKHLPPALRAYGRMQGRKPMLDDLNRWSRESGSSIRWTRADLMNPELDVLIAQLWLHRICGPDATTSEYCRTWNGGHYGRKSNQARNYYRRAKNVKESRPDYYAKCLAEVKRVQ